MLHINKTLQRVYIKDNNVKKSKVIITNPKTHNAHNSPILIPEYNVNKIPKPFTELFIKI